MFFVAIYMVNFVMTVYVVEIYFAYISWVQSSIYTYLSTC